MPLYQRTQAVLISGGGLFPGTSFRLTIRNPAGDYVRQTTLASDSRGNFNSSWRIPEDALTEVYTIFVDGTGTFDDASQDYVSQMKFSVTQATLSATIVEQPATSYQRTENAQFKFSLKYPDESSVVKLKTGITPAVLLQNRSTVGYAPVVLADEANGIWEAAFKIPVNATPGTKYRFDLPAQGFDDGSGNTGGASDAFTDFFQVTNASLQISSQVNGTQIQVPFGQISIISKITYPDGSEFTNGTARVFVSAGSSEYELPLYYDPSISAWRASYSSSITDLWQVGTWKLRVEATDSYGNHGTATYEIAAQPYLLFVLIGLAVAVVVLGRWVISRYGRRTYFRIWKIIRRFRRPVSRP